MKYLVAGLGNIGFEYEHTRHNIGFKIVDALADKAGASFISGRLANHCSIKHKGRTIILIKPTTFMNLSGKSIQYWLQAEKIPLERFMVVLDDLALPFGQIRIRSKGGDGGHNGLKDISSVLSTDAYVRLRFGIGNEFNKGKQVDYVLGKWSDEEEKLLASRISLSCEAIMNFVSSGLNSVMNTYNNK